MDKPRNNKNDLDDVFFTDIDESTSQKIISEIEDQREFEGLKNVKET